MRFLGFDTSVPEKWNKLWVGMWFVFTVGLLALAFFVPFWPIWVLLTVPLFWIPELISIRGRRDAFPPLTHTIRHFLPDWLAFALVYFAFGSTSAQALGFARPLHLGALFAVLGFLTNHLTVTYRESDPFPGDQRSVDIADLEPRRTAL